MSYRLFICEKPSQANDLARNLSCRVHKDGSWSDNSGKTVVTWCLGHLLSELLPDAYDPKYKKWSLATLPIIPETWKYEVKPKVKKQYQIVTGLIKSSSEVVIATDFDREGEAIARNILNRVKYRGPLSRLCLTALDDRSIQKALSRIVPGTETEALYEAALGRARADWLVGMNLSRFYTLKIQEANRSMGVISIGRVITPTVTLVVDRDLSIENFKPVAYYELYANVIGNNIQYRAKWQPDDNKKDHEDHVIERRFPEEVIKKCEHSTPVVTFYERKEKKQNPPLPFDLTSLQQFANRRWGYSANQTLNIAQSLYEKHKALTYPRTDSRYLPTDQFQEVSDIFKALEHQDPEVKELLKGTDITKKPSCYRTSGVTAHNAIVPTANTNVDLSAMTKEERNVFIAARRAFIAQFYPSAVYDTTTIILEAENEKFKAASKTLKSPGWQILYKQDPDKPEKAPRKKGDSEEEEVSSQILPEAQVGDQHKFQDFEIEDKVTTPPQHFTEATLLAAMENIARYVTEPTWKKMLKETDGLGTPATRAGIIDSALKWEYIVRQGKNILSTPKSRYLVKEVLSENLTSPGMTAMWEQRLEKIANGSKNETEKEFEKNIAEFITDIINNNSSKVIPTPPSSNAVPKSSSRRTRVGGTSSSNDAPKRSSRKSSFNGNSGSDVENQGLQNSSNNDRQNTDAANANTAICALCGGNAQRNHNEFGWYWFCKSCRQFLKDDNGTPKPKNQTKAKKPSSFSERPEAMSDYPESLYNDGDEFSSNNARTHQVKSSNSSQKTIKTVNNSIGSQENTMPTNFDNGNADDKKDSKVSKETYAKFRLYHPEKSGKRHTFENMFPNDNYPEGFGKFKKSNNLDPNFLVNDPLTQSEPPHFDEDIGDPEELYGGMGFGGEQPNQNHMPEPALGEPNSYGNFDNYPPRDNQFTGSPYQNTNRQDVQQTSQPKAPNNASTSQASNADSELRCPVCGKPYHRVTWNGSAFWSCGNRACRSTLSDDNGKPVPRDNSNTYQTKQAGSSFTSNNSRNENTPTCPTCGAPMRLRNGVRGRFWGCSNFPKCRGTKNYEE